MSMSNLAREDPNVDTFRLANHATDRIAEKPLSPCRVSTVSNEDLRNSFLTCELDDCCDRIVAFQHFGDGTSLLGNVDNSPESQLCLWRTRLTRKHV